MRLEIVGELLRGLHDCRDELFEGEVMDLYLVQLFAYVIDGLLCAVIFSN